MMVKNLIAITACGNEDICVQRSLLTQLSLTPSLYVKCPNPVFSLFIVRICVSASKTTR